MRLHKIASNRRRVMTAFPPLDHANDLRDLDLSGDNLPIQHSLGLEWDIREDMFTFRVPTLERPLNSLYDPLGFTDPVTNQGKFILRELPQEMHEK